MNKKWRVIFFVIALIVISGCGKQEEDVFDIMIYSNLSSQLQDDTKELVLESVNGLSEEEVRVFFHPVILEKMVVDIVANEGDVIIVDQEIINAAYDDEGLLPLESFLDEELIETIGEEFKSVNDETGEIHVHAVPLTNHSVLLRRLGVESERPLIAFVPIYGKHKEEAFQFIEHMAKREE